MPTESDKQGRNSPLAEEAALWIARLASGEATSSEKRQAQGWRHRSPEHEAAFQEAKRLWLGMEGVRDTFMQTDDMFEQQATTSDNQITWRKWAVAAALTLVTLGAILQIDRIDIWLADYQTSTGEHTNLTLADGSTIHLNTNTALSVEYTPRFRRVKLLAGEAQFHVADDHARPFIVHAGEGQTRAIGTTFVVRRHAQGAEVTLLEGLVDVKLDTPLSGKTSYVQLDPGRHVTYDTIEGMGEAQPADLRLATAWQRGVLIFEGTPLWEVVEEINRYRSGYVVLTNKAIANDRVSGVFHLANLDHALETIQTQLQLTSMRFADYIVFLQ
ncbi:MAG: sensor [Nitrospirales bacterium]|nr:MAG: sensor [Nitrospirales bacterium]